MSAKYWYGKEIEGRLYGLESVFISTDLTNDELTEVKKVHHLLIGTSLIDEIQKGDTTITWDMIFDWIVYENKYVTLEAKPEQIKNLPQKIKLRCHILLWLDVPELYDLKETDSVKLCHGLHEMYVTSFMNCQRVTKNDYYHNIYKK